MSKRYVAVGAGGRIPMFIDPIVTDYKDVAQLVALCDISKTRMEFHRKRLTQEHGAPDMAIYDAADFDRMIQEQKPDAVIVCTVDSLHHEYIIRSLDLGCDVICEKPITVDAEKCRAIQDAINRTGKKVRVTFNYRWSPGVSKVYELVQSGKIGKVQHVNLEYYLDTRHGADYFRRWHANMASSGGLLVHKSTHHFDLVNWWVDSIPDVIFAQGRLAFYGRKNAEARGDAALAAYDRYTGQAPDSDPFKLDLTSGDKLRELYLDAEEDSGYVRDRNVFRDDVDIYDTMSVLVSYRNGTTLNYSLTAYNPFEGFRVSLLGDKGRIEYTERHGSHIIKGQSDEELAAEQAAPEENDSGKYSLRVSNLFSNWETIEIQEAKGGHGGGDPLIQEQIFATNPPADPLHRNAGYEQGIASAIIGIAANESIASGEPRRVLDLVELRPGATKLTELI